MQNSTGLRVRLSFCAAAVPNNRRRVRREDGAKYHVMGLLLGRRFGLAQPERAASRPDLPTHLAQNEHAAAPSKEPLFLHAESTEQSQINWGALCITVW